MLTHLTGTDWNMGWPINQPELGVIIVMMMMGEIQGAKTRTERGHAFGDCYFLEDPDEDTQ